MKGKIMVVDDDPDTVDVIKTILEQEGYDISTASDGEECLKKLRKSVVDLVLLDIMMPGIDGRETFRKIKKKYENIGVILLTVVNSNEEEKKLLFAQGLINYILKPFDSAELLGRIELYMRKTHV